MSWRSVRACYSFRKKECSRIAYSFAVSIAAYWAFILGLAMFNISESI